MEENKSKITLNPTYNRLNFSAEFFFAKDCLGYASSRNLFFNVMIHCHVKWTRNYVQTGTFREYFHGHKTVFKTFRGPHNAHSTRENTKKPDGNMLDKSLNSKRRDHGQKLNFWMTMVTWKKPPCPKKVICKRFVVIRGRKLLRRPKR